MTAEVKPNYPAIRRALIERGFSVRSWALSKGHSPSTVYDAAKGNRNGVVATRIRRQLQEATHV